MKRTQIDWFVVITAIVFAVGCSGAGCGGCAGFEPIPGGFPAAKRRANAAQLRVTSSAIDLLEADLATMLGPLVGSADGDVVTFEVPSSCGGNPAICCPGGQPSAVCGPLEIDLAPRAGDVARVVLTPASVASPNGRLDVTMRARVKTKMDLVLSIGGTDCNVHLDTTDIDGTSPDLALAMQIGFTQDNTTKTTRIAAANTQITLEDADYSITPVSAGDFLCFGSAFIPRSLIENQLEGFIQNIINDQTCKKCPSGNVAECGSPFASACTNDVCMQTTNQCFQELGIAGRLRGSALLANLSPGTTGSLDLYQVAGGYSLSNSGGLSLGLLGGIEPQGTVRDKCGPSMVAPTFPMISPSAFFNGNTRPDTGTAYHVGIGVHASQLDKLAYAGYEGGLFCLTVGASTIAQLSTDTISILSRSLGRLVETNSPMAVGLRPQRPPVISLGANTFKDNGGGEMVPDDPLLDIRLQGVELDFFASIDDQYNRVFTVVTDVHLTMGLQTAAQGQLTPVIGTPDDAFTNVSVKNNEAITESPAEIAGLFPTLLTLVLPQLSGAISPFQLPSFGGLALNITAVTSVDFEQYLAIYANLAPATMARPVDTSAELAGIVEPEATMARDASKWRGARPTAVTLALGGNAPDLEFSWRTNGGAWSGWTTNARPTLSPSVFWLPGTHRVEVRARQIGRPETIDTTPVSIDLQLGTDVPLVSEERRAIARAGFHGGAGEGGCSCQTTTSRSGALGTLLVALVVGLLVAPRRLRGHLLGVFRRARRLGAIVWLAALASLPGCSCGNPCGDVECLPGEVERGSLGRFTSIAADNKRVLVATYDQGLGDLVVVDATDRENLVYVAVDGVPEGSPRHDPDSYRGGIEEEGPNVGAWTSIAIAGEVAGVAYQNRENVTLEYAYETAPNRWAHHTIDSGAAPSGPYASLAIDADNRAAIAYLALGIDDGAGHRNTELRLVRATSANPTAASDWASSIIAAAPGSCAGLCGSQQCVVGATVIDPQQCVTPSTSCGTSCGDGEACVAGTCRATVAATTLSSPPMGVGMYVSLVVLPDGRLAATYYDSTRRALVLSVEATRGANDFAETILDGNVAGRDRGMWSSAVVSSDGTIHVAYQDALADQLMYTSFSNTTAGTPVVVDDGVRAGDRPHPVGAAASIFVMGGEPAIAYQDGLVSDVYLATRGGGSWTTTPLATGPLLDGFSIASTTGSGGPVLAWGSLDPSLPVPSTLVVATP